MLCYWYDSVQVVFVEFGWCNYFVFFPVKIVYSAFSNDLQLQLHLL